MSACLLSYTFPLPETDIPGHGPGLRCWQRAGAEGEGQEQEQDIRRIGAEAGVCGEAGAGYCQQMASCYWSSEMQTQIVSKSPH